MLFLLCHCHAGQATKDKTSKNMIIKRSPVNQRPKRATSAPRKPIKANGIPGKVSKTERRRTGSTKKGSDNKLKKFNNEVKDLLPNRCRLSRHNKNYLTIVV